MLITNQTQRYLLVHFSCLNLLTELQSLQTIRNWSLSSNMIAQNCHMTCLLFGFSGRNFTVADLQICSVYYFFSCFFFWSFRVTEQLPQMCSSLFVPCRAPWAICWHFLEGSRSFTRHTQIDGEVLWKTGRERKMGCKEGWKRAWPSFIARLTEQRPWSELPLFWGSLHINLEHAGKNTGQQG